MRIAVAGATGNIGARTVAALERAGQEVVRISRAQGVDLSIGEGLERALTGVDTVVDVSNGPATDRAEAVDFFGTATRNLLAAGERAGVRHHVLLSIVGIDRVEGNAHYAGKREQERLVAAGPLPWTIVPATQFHDFAAMVAGWTERDGVATIAPLLVQPIAPADVADVLAEIAVGEPRGRHPDVAGPEPQDLVDMARRTNEARGHRVRLVPTWSGLFGPAMAGTVLLPGEGARITPTTFDEWLAEQRQDHTSDRHADAEPHPTSGPAAR
ncbi:NAD(P)H-binding protein [Micromonospora sp. WMMD1102]|uniref:SDR family oxidoreductase n=1 Tax=Micromonospora sp. WMMD1102 TaxID=3016105 RepID=UPI002414FCCC|nr:NAD(P)H-binding protein [Micromonospora sp. WMMD1102]MDG4786458.1 NAD(P)H-binding protein [Micromonospora sp. WMMD1102]